VSVKPLTPKQRERFAEWLRESARQDELALASLAAKRDEWRLPAFDIRLALAAKRRVEEILRGES
jgi:hypothetical protein